MPPRRAIMEPMQNILPVLCFVAGFALAWLIWHGRSAARAADLQATKQAQMAHVVATIADFYARS